MFRCLPLFASIPCPALTDDRPCNIPRCLFSHENITPPTKPTPTVSTESILSVDPRLRRIVEARSSSEQAAVELDKCKRQKIAEDGSRVAGRGSYQDGSAKIERERLSEDEDDGGGVRLVLDQPINNNIGNQKPVPANRELVSSTLSNKKKPSVQPVKSALKQVQPEKPKVAPISKERSSAVLTTSDKSQVLPSPKKPELKSATKPISAPLTLNPRLIPRSPAPHNVRYQLLEKLHKELTRLSGNPSDQDGKQVVLKRALDIEEETATEKKSIYTNVMKKTVLKYMKQKPAEYQKELEDIEKLEKEKAKVAENDAPNGRLNGKRKRDQSDLNNDQPALITGLDATAEISRLKELVHTPETLKAYNFLLQPPSSKEIENSRDGVEAASGWEVCERCKTRFQVFPGGRKSDGSLTSGGDCVYHPGRTYKAKSGTGSEQKWNCCQAVAETADRGCMKHKYHVFKVSEPKRLAVTLQYVATPPNKYIDEHEEARRAVAVDCEMGYTTNGMELIRVTATVFPSGKTLLDSLVRPFGDILDLNSRYSGVFPEMMASAKPLSKLNPPYPDINSKLLNPTAPLDGDPPQIPILPSPEAARQVLFGYITPNTPLIGHALDNDLHVLRICHPTIVDTVILFPHTGGPPFRNKLKYLSSTLLKRSIQVEGDQNGHDSAVDARCAAELVRYKIREMCERERRYSIYS